MTWNRAGWSFFAKVGRLASQALGAVHVAGIIWVCQWGIPPDDHVNKNHDNSLTHWTLGTRYFQTCVSLCVPCWTYPHRRSLVEESQHTTSLFVGCTATYSLWWVLDAIYTHMFTVYIHYITLHHITLHYIRLHYITLHYITYIH